MESDKKKPFKKDCIRKVILVFADYIEILIAAIIIFVVALFSIKLLLEVFELSRQMFLHNNYLFSFESLLSKFFEIIIGIELVKMLSNHNLGTTLKLLLFVIARSVLANHSSSLSLLIGVVAIAIIFAIKKFLMTKNKKNDRL